MGALDTLDTALSGLLQSWNLYSTGLATFIVLALTIKLSTSREPDVHPMLLARQSNPSTVRQEGESPVYRSQAAPHGMPLNSGLNVKDPGASKWSRGRDGDLRDVWRQAVTGGEKGATGKILTVWGSQRVVEHKLGTSCLLALVMMAKLPVLTYRSCRGGHPPDQPHRAPHRGAGWH